MKPTVLVALVALASLSYGQQKTGAQQIVERQIAVYTRGMESKDVKSVMGVFAPTFSAKDQKGVTYNRDRVVIQLRSLFASAKKIHVAITIKTFKLEKGEARITCHDLLEVELPDAHGKLVKYVSDSISDEVWAPLNATWKIRSSKTVSESRTVDGKPVAGG